MRRIAVFFIVTVPALTSCGLEGVFSELGDTDNVQPVSGLRGSLMRSLNTGERQGTLTYLNSLGQEVEPYDVEIGTDRYAVDLFSETYERGKLIGQLGEIRFERYIPALPPESVTEELDLDADARAIALMIDTYLAAFEKPISTIAPDNMARATERMEEMFETQTPGRQVRDTVQLFLETALEQGTRSIFNRPDFRVEVRDDPNTPGSTITELFANRSTINPEWLSIRGLDTSTGAFDRALGQAAIDLKLEGCPDPDFITAIFEVDFNEGQLSANCSVINRDKWLRGVSDPGKRMYFVGGIHEDSPVPQDSTLRSEINGMLGNRGGWTPNTVPMFDDGTHGDETANDGIWTVSFVLPRGTRMGYKYTWGVQGVLWAGTEEWPGNQHILEIVDVNGDNFVRRRDNFGDETTNKDRSNAYSRGTGSVTWDTDANQDGFLDARELPLDQDNDCTLDEFITPTSVAPATVDCDALEGMQ